MIYDRLDGSKTDLNTGPIGILRQAGLEITMDRDGYVELDFKDVGGYSAAGKYRESFLQLSSNGMETTQQSGSVVAIQVKSGSPLDSHVALPGHILGLAIRSNDTLGQQADSIMETMATPKPATPSVAGGSGFAYIP